MPLVDFRAPALIEVPVKIPNGKGEKVHFLAGTAVLLCAVNLFIGRIFAWLSLDIVAVCFTVLVKRYLYLGYRPAMRPRGENLA